MRAEADRIVERAVRDRAVEAELARGRTPEQAERWADRKVTLFRRSRDRQRAGRARDMAAEYAELVEIAETHRAEFPDDERLYDRRIGERRAVMDDEPFRAGYLERLVDRQRMEPDPARRGLIVSVERMPGEDTIRQLIWLAEQRPEGQAAHLVTDMAAGETVTQAEADRTVLSEARSLHEHLLRTDETYRRADVAARAKRERMAAAGEAIETQRQADIEASGYGRWDKLVGLVKGAGGTATFGLTDLLFPSIRPETSGGAVAQTVGWFAGALLPGAVAGRMVHQGRTFRAAPGWVKGAADFAAFEAMLQPGHVAEQVRAGVPVGEALAAGGKRIGEGLGMGMAFGGAAQGLRAGYRGLGRLERAAEAPARPPDAAMTGFLDYAKGRGFDPNAIQRKPEAYLELWREWFDAQPRNTDWWADTVRWFNARARRPGAKGPDAVPEVPSQPRPEARPEARPEPAPAAAGVDERLLARIEQARAAAEARQPRFSRTPTTYTKPTGQLREIKGLKTLEGDDVERIRWQIDHSPWSGQARRYAHERLDQRVSELRGEPQPIDRPFTPRPPGPAGAAPGEVVTRGPRQSNEARRVVERIRGARTIRELDDIQQAIDIREAELADDLPDIMREMAGRRGDLGMTAEAGPAPAPPTMKPGAPGTEQPAGAPRNFREFVTGRGHQWEEVSGPGADQALHARLKAEWDARPAAPAGRPRPDEIAAMARKAEEIPTRPMAGAAEVPAEPGGVKAEPAGVKPAGQPAQLRKLADALDRQIQAKRNPAIGRQAPTRRRAGIAAGMAAEADDLERVQTALRGMADDIEAGTLPEALAGVRNKAQVEDLLHRKSFRDYVFVHRAWLRDVIEEAKGLPGVGPIRDALSGSGEQLRTPRMIEALEKLVGMLKHSKRRRAGSSLSSINSSLKEYRRLQRMGITTEKQFNQAKEALKAYARPKSAAEKRAAEVARQERDLIGQKIPGFFPTPKPVAERMLQAAGIRPGMKVLEPSAGKGDLADVVRGAADDVTVDTLEYSQTLRPILEQKGHRLVGSDFLETDVAGQYDRIVMNPPFEKGQDIEHVRRAFEQVKPGGRVVAIMSEGPFFRTDTQAAEFRRWLESVGGVSEKLPEGSFKSGFRPTGVATRMVTIDKPAGRPRPDEIAAMARKAEEIPGSPGAKGDDAVAFLNTLRRDAVATAEKRGAGPVAEKPPSEKLTIKRLARQAIDELTEGAEPPGILPRGMARELERGLGRRGAAAEAQSPLSIAELRRQARDNVRDVRRLAREAGLARNRDYRGWQAEAEAKVWDTFQDWLSFRKRARGKLRRGELQDMTFYLQRTGNPLREGDTYEALAKRMSPQGKRAARDVRAFLDEFRDFHNERGADLAYRMDYITQMYETPRGVDLNAAMRRADEELFQKFRTYNPFENARAFETYEAAMRGAGLRPKYDNVVELVLAYTRHTNRVTGNRMMLKRLLDMKRPDGTPMVLTSSTRLPGDVALTHPVMQVAQVRGRATLPPKGQGAEAMARWREAGKRPEAVKIELGPAYVPREVAETLERQLGPNQNWGIVRDVGRGIQTVTAMAKASRLMLSLFHPVALVESGIASGSGLSPVGVLRAMARGKRLLRDPERARAAARAGLNVGAMSDLQRGRVDQTLKRMERLFEEAVPLPPIAQTIRGLRAIKQAQDRALWDWLHAGLKSEAWERHTTKLLADKRFKHLGRDEIERQVAEHVNNAFGGQNWEDMLRLPRSIEAAGRLGLFALDWTTSNIKIALDAVPGYRGLMKGLGKVTNERLAGDIGAIRVHLARRYWARAAVMMTTYANALNWLLTSEVEEADGKLRFKPGHFIWDNDVGHNGGKRGVDITQWDINLGIQDQEGRDIYLRPFKQMREVFRWALHPLDEYQAKLSWLPRQVVQQTWGTTGGRHRTEYQILIDEENRHHLFDRRVALARLKGFLEEFTPFSMTGGNPLSLTEGSQFGMAIPTARGATFYNTTAGYRDVLRTATTPAELKEGLEAYTRRARANNIDYRSAYDQAIRRERDRYVKNLAHAIRSGDRERAREALEILTRNLGVDTASALRRAGGQIPASELRDRATLEKVFGRRLPRALFERTPRREGTVEEMVGESGVRPRGWGEEWAPQSD